MKFKMTLDDVVLGVRRSAYACATSRCIQRALPRLPQFSVGTGNKDILFSFVKNGKHVSTTVTTPPNLEAFVDAFDDDQMTKPEPIEFELPDESLAPILDAINEVAS